MEMPPLKTFGRTYDVNLEDIISSGCVYHRTCYAEVGNKTKRQVQAEVRKIFNNERCQRNQKKHRATYWTT